MHELSIATDLISVALETAKQNNAKKVLSVTVEVGELAMVNPEQLTFMYEVLTEDEELTKGDLLKGSKLNLVTVPAVMECQSCGYRGPITDKYTCACPRCSLTMRAVEGRDICLKTMEIDV
jgi:hydrogenase nickel incorporation protein HypA/HybF